MFVKAGGTLIRRELEEGEQLRISSGCLVAFSSDVEYGELCLILLCIECSVLSKDISKSLTHVDFRRPNAFWFQECHVWRRGVVHYYAHWPWDCLVARSAATENGE